MFRKMLGDYELETQDLITKAQDISNQIQESRNNQADVHRWMKLIKECAGVEKLDRAQAYRLIDQVSVHEKADECGIRTHTVKIKYNFVGDISLN